MNQNELALYDQLICWFSPRERIDAQGALSRTEMGTIRDWAYCLAVLASSGLLRIRSSGASPDGLDTEYELGEGAGTRLQPYEITRLQRTHVQSGRIRLALKSLIAHFGGSPFGFKEALAVTGQPRGIVMAVIDTARNRGWIAPVGGYLFCLDRIPPEWKPDVQPSEMSPTMVSTGLTREQRLYLIWKMGTSERVGWDYILTSPLGFGSRTELHNFVQNEAEIGEFFVKRKFGRTAYFYWKKEPPKFPHLDHLLDDD